MMKSHAWLLVAALPVSLLLAACSAEDEEPSALDNNSRNQQEHQNTATDPTGPRQLSTPSTKANE